MYKKESARWLKHYDFLLLDIFCLELAFFLALVVRFGDMPSYSIMEHRNMAIILAFADLIIVFMMDTFHSVLKRGYYKEFVVAVQNAILVGMLSVVYLFAVHQAENYSRTVFLVTFIFYLCFSYFSRVILKKLLKKKMISGDDRTLLIVTTWKKAKTVIEEVKSNNYAMFKIAGLVIVDRDMAGETIEGVPVVANGSDAPMYVCKEWIDDVLIVPSKKKEFPKEIYEKFIETGVTVHYKLAKTLDMSGEKQFVEKFGRYSVLTTSMNYVSSRQLLAKRVLDIMGGFVGCILTGIVFVLIAPAIYISSPGPIFFSQERVGKNGKKFKIYKFRSMYMDAEARKAELMDQNKIGDAKMFKLDFDPRVIGNKILPNGKKKTGIGNFIRATSLDEFPQFLNVLKGDMSLVGPRPPLVGEVSEYDLRHRARLSMKPGITGLWQVSGRSDITDFEEVVQLDRQYISEWNIGLDIKILIKTVLVVLKKEGSV